VIVCDSDKESTMRWTTVGFIAGLLAAGAIAGSAQANRFNSAESSNMDALTKRILTELANVLSVSGALGQKQEFDNVDCLTEIHNVLSELYEIVEYVSTLISIDSQMETRNDEKVVLEKLATEVEYGQNVVSGDRNHVNRQAITCRTSALVVSHAQITLGLINEVERVLSNVQRRL
jgi:hypothetical protein